MLEKPFPAAKNTWPTKLDFCLENQAFPVLIAWARETNHGVYMGVRFSPDVENISFFKDGKRQWLRFPMMSDGKRKREEVPFADGTPIEAIQRFELILSRRVNVYSCLRSSG